MVLMVEGRNETKCEEKNRRLIDQEASSSDQNFDARLDKNYCNGVDALESFFVEFKHEAIYDIEAYMI